MKILYFAWLREKTGIPAEVVTLPDGVADVNGLIRWLSARGAGFADAFAEPSLVRAAVNQEHVKLEHPLADDDEVAFFPPVTGG